MTTDARLGPKLAEGRTAEIYAWEPGWVLKLYFNWVPAEDAAHEARVTKAAHDSGFSAPATGDSLQIDGRTGLVMQLVQGQEMLAALLQQPWRAAHFARLLAKLHLNMHACRPSNLPDLNERLARRLETAPGLPEDLRRRLLARLRTLPSGDRLCHGDLHPQNVIMAHDGAKVIDWVDAKRGNPLADVARTTVLLTMGSVPPNPVVRLLVATFRRRFHSVYLKTYFAGNPEAKDEYRQWLPIVAAARLTEGIEEENPLLIEAAERWMAA